MTTIVCQREPTGSNQHRPCRWLSLAELIDRIAQSCDGAAMREFHEHRPIFRVDGASPVLFLHFIELVLSRYCVQGPTATPTLIRDRAYDLMLDKFLNVPESRNTRPDREAGGRRTDCRHYFAMLSRTIRSWRDRNTTADDLTLEAAAARIAQRRVARHCRLSILEAKRSHYVGQSRYRWCRPDGTLTLWMPLRLSGIQRGKWLAEHAGWSDPTRPGEQKRVQAFVNAHWGMIRVEPLSARSPVASPRPSGEHLVQCELTIRGLAGFVAKEKALRIAEQRPAIRRLGQGGIQALVHSIFDDMASDCLQDRQTAARFNLSPATYSRFAGSRWTPGGKRPPDLWLNVARILASCPTFRDAARAAGIWQRVERVVRADSPEDSADDQ